MMYDGNYIDLESIAPVVRELYKSWANVYLVGGCVRDLKLGITPKDIDIEVYGINEYDLEKILEEFGSVKKVGKSFGVWKFKPHNGEGEFDIAIPRKEVKVGNGHNDFIVELDPIMRLKEAASRRDFTINSLMLDIGALDREIEDFFGGISDLNNRVLKHVSDDHFAEDPLRPLRAMQFAGRFGMTVDDDTAALCMTMFEDGMHKALSVERIWVEFEKWATKSLVPSRGLRVLADIGWIEMFPELSVLMELEQDPGYHPEGTVFQHTMCTVDEMAAIISKNNIKGQDQVVLMLAALCHDFGKATTTAFEDGRIRSKGHAKAGADPTESFLNRIGAPRVIIDRVLPLVVEHMVAWGNKPSKRAVRRLARRLESSTINELHMVIKADCRGRPPSKPKDPFKEFVEIADSLNLVDDTPKPILMGRHLLEKGFKPGPLMGKLLKQAFEAQLDGEFDDLEGAIRWFSTIGKDDRGE